jgi:DNA replication protein DnaC
VSEPRGVVIPLRQAVDSVVPTSPPRTCIECGAATSVDGPERGTLCAASEEREQARRRREEDEERRRILDHHLGLIGLPLAYRSSRFETLRSTPITATCRAWLANRGVSRGRFLALLGPTGVGKTAAAAAVVIQLVDSIRSDQRFTLAGALYRRLRDFDAVNEAMKESATTRLLVLDDFQAPPATVAAMLEELLIDREANARATILTSNLTQKKLLEVLSDRVVDRVRSWGEIREFPGKSLRAPEAQA